MENGNPNSHKTINLANKYKTGEIVKCGAGFSLIVTSVLLIFSFAFWWRGVVQHGFFARRKSGINKKKWTSSSKKWRAAFWCVRWVYNGDSKADLRPDLTGRFPNKLSQDKRRIFSSSQATVLSDQPFPVYYLPLDFSLPVAPQSWYAARKRLFRKIGKWIYKIK